MNTDLDHLADEFAKCDHCEQWFDPTNGQITAESIICPGCIEKAQEKTRQDAIPQTFDEGEAGA